MDRAEPAIRRLNCLSPLEDREKELIRRLAGALSQHRVGADLGDDSDVSSRFLVEGWACRVSETPWGGRQILDFLLPGDAIGFSLRARPDGLYRIVALSRCLSFDARALRDWMRGDPQACPGVSRASIQDERARAERMIDHTNRLGGATATQAMAHLLLEFHARLAQVDLVDEDRFAFPLNQEALGEALGITITQVYRVLTLLRRDQLISLGPGWAQILDKPALAAAAGTARSRR